MYLKKLNLLNFKNYPEAEIAFCRKINCFTGDNGVGKTNILDAIHYLSMTKSFFNTVDSQNIRHHEDFFLIQGEYELKEELMLIHCGMKRNRKKQFMKDKKEYERFSDHIGLLPVVMISPSDSSLIMDSGEERRKFINNVISQYDQVYLDAVISYNKALTNRNKLLKNFQETRTFDIDMLDVWDEQLIQKGSLIRDKRISFISEIKPYFDKYYEFVSGGKEDVSIDYQSDTFDLNYKDILLANREKDRILCHTSTGIHRDDLEFSLNNYPIRKIGSQGQQKTFLVALKLANFEFISSQSNTKPILLLDDIFDKFDHNRVRQIIELVADENFGQIFITDTQSERIKSVLEGINRDHKLFRVANDIITEEGI